MRKNSIRESLKYDDIIGELRLTLAANHNQPIVIVEGSDDIDFFNLFCSSDVIIRESYAGKVGVLRIMEFFCDKKSVIGICDQDYSGEIRQNIFYYDYSCIEMMIISNNVVFNHFVKVCYLPSRTTRVFLMRQLVWLSCLRKLNYLNNWAVRLEGIVISSAFSIDAPLNRANLMGQLGAINNDRAPLTEEQLELVDSNVELINSEDEMLSITQGHDCVRLIQCHHEYYARLRKRKLLSDVAIKKSLYCAYKKSEFESSQLYRKITEYAKSNNLLFFD